MSQIADLIVDGPLAAFTQELLVLGVFFFSFVVWRHFSRSGNILARGQVKVSGRDDAAKPFVKKRDAGRVSCLSLGGRQQHPQLQQQPQQEHQQRWRSQQPRPPQEEQQPEREQQQQPPQPAQIRAAEHQMLRHLEQREFTRALNMYRALERDGRDRNFSVELYSAFIQSSIRVGKVDVVERMLRAMKRVGLVPTLQFWQTTLKMLSSRKHFSACLSAQSIFGDLIPADKVVFSCLINAALEIGLTSRAAAMLERYGQADLDVKDHVLYFRTYVMMKDVDAAEAVFRKLGDGITTLMLNLLLLTCVNAKQPQRGLDLLRESHRIEEGAPDKIVDVVSYNTVIKGFALAGQPQDCFVCLHEMLAQALEPDDITFGTLLDACIVDNDIGAANEIVGLFVGSARSMDTVMCTLFIKGLVRASCLPKALELYDEMKRREGARPDIVTYSVLIKALVDQHDLERALRLVEDMAAAGHSPDDIILTHLLEGCRHAGNRALGERLFKEMLAAGVKPSEFTLVTMLKLYGRCGAHREAHELVAGWEEKHGLKPSVIHYTCLMSGCLRTKSYDQAWAAYELMCTRGIAPDGTSVATLLPGMVAAQQWGRVLELARQALKAPAPVSIPTETMNNALSQMLGAPGAARQVEALQALMESGGIPITARNAKRLS